MHLDIKKILKLEALLKSFKAKLLDEQSDQGKKLRAAIAKIQAIRALKQKNPNVDWSKLMPKAKNIKSKLE